MRSGMSQGASERTKRTPNTNLCDLLDIPDRLETELELSEGGHVTGILGSGAQDRLLGWNAGERPPCEHYGRYNKKTKAGCVTTSGVLAHKFGGLAVAGNSGGASEFRGCPVRRAAGLSQVFGAQQSLSRNHV